jgi:hypothetical protein
MAPFSLSFDTHAGFIKATNMRCNQLLFDGQRDQRKPHSTYQMARADIDLDRSQQLSNEFHIEQDMLLPWER